MLVHMCVCLYPIEKTMRKQWRGRDVLFGSRIGLQDSDTYGCVGFLVKSNVTSAVPITGFLTAAHTVIKELKQVYDKNSMLSEYKQKTHCMMAKEAQVVVQYTCSKFTTPEPVGEVVEAFFGNYNPPGSDCAFGMDVAFVKSFNPYMGGKSVLLLFIGRIFYTCEISHSKPCIMVDDFRKIIVMTYYCQHMFSILP